MKKSVIKSLASGLAVLSLVGTLTMVGSPSTVSAGDFGGVERSFSYDKDFDYSKYSINKGSEIEGIYFHQKCGAPIEYSPFGFCKCSKCEEEHWFISLFDYDYIRLTNL